MRPTPKVSPVLAAPLLLLAIMAPPATGQGASPEQRPAPLPVPVPFGPAEEASYQVKMGVFNVGQGRLAVAGVDTIRGRASYRLEMDLEGSVAMARVKYDLRSWLDVSTLASRRHLRDIVEIRTPRTRAYEIYPEERRWERTDVEDAGESPSPLPLDELSFVYYVRTLPLVVGETYTLNRYFKEEGNPVVVRVLRKDTREVPAGRFNTIVVQPVIQTSGLFSQGGNAEIHFSDDVDRYVVYLRTEVPLVGSLTLHLTEYRRGTSLRR